MRVQVPLFTLMCVALTCAPAPAQEAEALRKEIEQLQRQLKALGDRLQRLESQPPPAAPAGPGGSAINEMIRLTCVKS